MAKATGISFQNREKHFNLSLDLKRTTVVRGFVFTKFQLLLALGMFQRDMDYHGKWTISKADLADKISAH